MLSVQVNTQLHYFILPAVCWLVFGPGDHVMTVSSAFSPISPAARQTVSSTIKGCAIMKGALAEAIYFSAQCRKVSPALIFQCRLCVLYSAIKGGIRRTHTSWTNEVGGGASKHKATFHHSWKSILIWIFLLIYLCVFIFFLNYFINARSVCALPPLGFFPFSRLPPLPLFSAQLCTPHHQRPFLHYSCVHFVPLKFIELMQTAETQKIREALSAPLREMVLQCGWVSGVFVCDSYSRGRGADAEVIDRGNGEHCVLMFLLKGR